MKNLAINSIAKSFLPALLLMLLPALTAAADVWKLDGEHSSLSYLSSKMLLGSFSTVFEQNHFRKISAEIQDDSTRLLIDTASVETGVPIRDERVMQHVFESTKYPNAVVEVKLGKNFVDGLAVGAVEVREVRADLRIKELSHPVAAKLSITRIDDDRLLLQTVEPILVDAVKYEMRDGFKVLAGLVELFRIPTTIPVSFKLVFVK